MNRISIKYYILTLSFYITSSYKKLIANNNPPTPRGSGGFDDGVVVGGPIDYYLPLLFCVALIFGAFALNKLKSPKIN